MSDAARPWIGADSSSPCSVTVHESCANCTIYVSDHTDSFRACCHFQNLFFNPSVVGMNTSWKRFRLKSKHEGAHKGCLDFRVIRWQNFWFWLQLLCFFSWWRWAPTASWPRTIRTTLTTTTTAATTRWASSSTTTCVWKWLCGSSWTRRDSSDCTCTSEFRSSGNDVIPSPARERGSRKNDDSAESSRSFLFLKKQRLIQTFHSTWKHVFWWFVSQSRSRLLKPDEMAKKILVSVDQLADNSWMHHHLIW